MKTSYTAIHAFLFVSSASFTTAQNSDNGLSLEQCFPNDIPWYTYEGEDYIFTRMKYNSECIGTNNQPYQWGKIEGVWPPIDEPDSGCSKACVSGYGRGQARGCTSMKPENLVGFNYNCDEAACYCLYEKNTWTDDESPCFDEMDINLHGKGDVYKTRVQEGSTCYSLQVQPTPTPAPSSICEGPKDFDCYKTGRPACCSEDGGENCPDFMTMCDNHSEDTTGYNYCTTAPQYGCDPSTYSNMGWPLCCDEPGGAEMNCPVEQPQCNSDDESSNLNFMQTSEELANTCNKKCKKDSDCQKGGFVQCGTCNLTHGTQNYQRCYDDSTPSPTPAPIEVGQCGKHCHHDSDCAVGGFNSCFTCGKYEGTEYYHRCYDSSAVDETSTSVTNFVKYLRAHK